MELKLEQVAFGCRDRSLWDHFAKRAAVVDTVTFNGWYKPVDSQFVHEIKGMIGHLAFDYEIGIEREYLYYPSRLNFHDDLRDSSPLYLSHFASHVPSVDYYLANDPGMANRVVMDVVTIDHKNEKLIKLGRKYRYAIIDTRKQHGYYTKLIQRIEHNATASTDADGRSAKVSNQK